MSNEVEYSDNCGASLVYTGPDTEPIEVQGDSSFVQTWEVTDPSGNLTMCSRTVDVQYAPPVTIEQDGMESATLFCFKVTTEDSPVSYQWSTGSTDSTECAEDGLLIVEVVYANGCSRTDEFDVDAILGTEQSALNGIRIYPNPARSFVLVEGDEVMRMKFEIFSISGQLLMSGSLSDRKSINIEQLSTGTYFIKMFDTDISHLHKLIVN